ncbi:MAG: hypothetical protein ACOYM1_08075 [Methylovulum sp.]
MSDFRRLIYQDLHEQKSALERAANLVRLRELEAETHKNELELKAANSTIDFNFDSEGNPKLKRDTMTRLGRDTELQTEAVKDAGTGNNAGTVKPRKKLKPLERETNEALLLIYEIFNYYEVEYLDELPAHTAWGKIISKEFSSDLISNIATSNKYIILSGGEKLIKTDFSDKYRRRFE